MIKLDDIEAKAKASWELGHSETGIPVDQLVALVRIARAAKDMIKEWEDSYENHGFLFSVEVETRIKEALRGVE